MNYEWDKYKARSNYRKHGIDFADAVSVFNDDDAILILDDHPDEERFATLGMDSFARILVVVHTWFDTHIRIISARKATRPEQQQYFGN